jgi:Family of unknown function (DUF6521)
VIMPESQLHEVEIVQNPGLGSVIIWKFGLGYQAETGSLSPVMPLVFLVLPIALHAPTLGWCSRPELARAWRSLRAN